MVKNAAVSWSTRAWRGDPNWLFRARNCLWLRRRAAAKSGQAYCGLCPRAGQADKGSWGEESGRRGMRSGRFAVGPDWIWVRDGVTTSKASLGTS